MYSTCIFCQQGLGRNEAIEHFPVGRRLAFDEAKGRLWVVCRKCERWNLTPLEERWEAIEECQRAFCSTRMRVSTDHIGLARLKEGLELVRIGEPRRPEMAAWRYGDQFGRRRVKRFAMIGGAAVIVGGVILAGPVLGLVGAPMFNPVFNLFNAGRGIYRWRTRLPIGLEDGTMVPVPLAKLAKVTLKADKQDIVLGLTAARPREATPWWKYDRGEVEYELHGDAAIRAAGVLLPQMNLAGGSRKEVSAAVDVLERAGGDPSRLFHNAMSAIGRRDAERIFSRTNRNMLSGLPTTSRLALEMAAHEDSERRALEGELHELEAAWKDAEEIAGIADDMFLPDSVTTALARMKRQRDAG
ncbi:hypothetical protein BH11GEM1_BH11GEM1_28610 [soil metagenome]